MNKHSNLFQVYFLSGTLMFCTWLFLYGGDRVWIYDDFEGLLSIFFHEFFMEPKVIVIFVFSMFFYYLSYKMYKKL
jgi:hypothetical protein